MTADREWSWSCARTRAQQAGNVTGLSSLHERMTEARSTLTEEAKNRKEDRTRVNLEPDA